MSEKIPQVPGPDEGDPPRGQRDPEKPTATGPDSVGESVYEEAEHAGKTGPDAADPPEAAGKSDGGGGNGDEPEGADALEDTEPGADLDPDEGADAFETHEEARDAKAGKEEQQRDEDQVSLDTPD